MYTITTSVDKIAPGKFRPPHCPRAECDRHRYSPYREFRYHKHGTFDRLRDGRLVPRFYCLTCTHTFSQATQDELRPTSEARKQAMSSRRPMACS